MGLTQTNVPSAFHKYHALEHFFFILTDFEILGTAKTKERSRDFTG